MEQNCCWKRDIGRDSHLLKNPIYSLYLSFLHLFTKILITGKKRRHTFFSCEPTTISVNMPLCLRDSKSGFLSITFTKSAGNYFSVWQRTRSVHFQLPQTSLYICFQFTQRQLAKQMTCQITESISLQEQDTVTWEIIYQILK